MLEARWVGFCSSKLIRCGDFRVPRQSLIAELDVGNNSSKWLPQAEETEKDKQD